MTKLVCITGGIGSGKSVVRRVLSTMGYDVYDTDERAKTIMDASDVIKSRLVDVFGNDTVKNGIIDRRYLGSVVFNDKTQLQRLNEIVHPAVVNDVVNWRDVSRAPIVFVETAIMYECGLDKYVDEVWKVTAPVGVRIERVMKRNNVTAQEVRARIDSQNRRDCHTHNRVRVIINDGRHAILPQINNLLAELHAGT